MSKPARKKATDLEVAKRVTQVIQWMIQGWSLTKILHYIAEDGLVDGNKDALGWGISERQAHEYYQKGLAFFKGYALTQVDIDAEFGKSLERLDDLYHKCMNSGRYNTALRALAERHKILGFHKLNINVKASTDLKDKSVDEIIKMLEREYNVIIPMHVLKASGQGYGMGAMSA